MSVIALYVTDFRSTKFSQCFLFSQFLLLCQYLHQHAPFHSSASIYIFSLILIYFYLSLIIPFPGATPDCLWFSLLIDLDL